MSRWSNRWAILLLAFICTAPPASAVDFDKVLENSKKVESKPVVSEKIQGVVEQSDRVQRQFIERDAEERARRAAAAASVPSSIPCRISSEICFNVVASSGGRVKIRCQKGNGFKIGKEHDICRGGNGKWATGCGITDTFAHHYEFSVAGNKACD